MPSLNSESLQVHLAYDYSIVNPYLYKQKASVLIAEKTRQATIQVGENGKQKEINLWVFQQPLEVS
jgi:hypothetical protein